MFDEPALRREVIDTLNAWEEAVRQHDLDRHMTYYSDTLDVYYKRSNVSKAYVRSTLTPAYDRYSTLDVQLSNISVAIDQSNREVNDALRHAAPHGPSRDLYESERLVLE